MKINEIRKRASLNSKRAVPMELNDSLKFPQANKFERNNLHSGLKHTGMTFSETFARGSLEYAIQSTESNQQCLYCSFQMECGHHDCVWKEVGA